jgi:hypothetical protein
LLALSWTDTAVPCATALKDGDVFHDGTGTVVMLKVLSANMDVDDVARALTVKENDPMALGVPDRAPDVESARPPGRAPDTSE